MSWAVESGMGRCVNEIFDYGGKERLQIAVSVFLITKPAYNLGFDYGCSETVTNEVITDS